MLDLAYVFGHAMEMYDFTVIDLIAGPFEFLISVERPVLPVVSDEGSRRCIRLLIE